ncbi:MAG: CinA family nicotinamide mononucleotide deamidase-related protein [Saprospiraceae bacterium]
MTAHLLTIGDEILIGQIIDTNSAWMSRELNLRGFRVVGKSSVSDTREAITEGIRHAAAQADVVIMTGGLGPTKDDVTKKTLCTLFDSGLVFHQDVCDRIAAYFEKIGRPMPESVREQAMLPERALILTNKVGTASGMWFDLAGKIYISLPGVPFEMEYLMTAEVLPRLQECFPGRPIVHRTLLTVGAGESAIAQRIEAFESALPAHIRLAYLPALGQVRLRLTGWGEGMRSAESLAALEQEVEAQAADLARLIPEIIFGRENETLEQVVGRMLQARGLQFGTAESCTGGYIAHLMTTVPGSSAYFHGAVVAYSNDLKRRLLGVPEQTLLDQGAVSEATVRAMAVGALDALGVDVALSISGIAGPDGGTPDKPVGTVWMAVADRRGGVTAVKHVFGRDRAKNIHLAGVYGLDLVRKNL